MGVSVPTDKVGVSNQALFLLWQVYGKTPWQEHPIESRVLPKLLLTTIANQCYTITEKNYRGGFNVLSQKNIFMPDYFSIFFYC